MQRLATRFGKGYTVTRSHEPLHNDELMRFVPSIFADAKHESRSERYTYIPTIQVLEGLRKEGFQPFYAAQSRVRDEGNKEHTKHMIRLRHANQIEAQEANEIILVNSHNGTSSYQMLSGVFRFVCANGMVCGDSMNDIRVPHKGDILSQVIEGAYTVLDTFELANAQMSDMKTLVLSEPEQQAFGRAALALKYDETIQAAPITENTLLRINRAADAGNDLWRTFNRVQENMIQGGLRGRSADGKKIKTRAITGIDQSIKINRALWTLAEEMKKLKA
jgi:hypothetical protein